MVNNIFSSANDVLYNAAKYTFDNGINVSARGLLTTEVPAFSFTLTNPRSRIISLKSRHWDYAYAIGELCWHLRGSNSLAEIAYYSKAWLQFSSNKRTIRSSCYGKKIFGGKINIWEKIIRILKTDKDSRRAVISLGNTASALQTDVSCINSIQFMIRNNKLNCIVYMRSNDIIWGLCYDLFFLTFLQEMLSYTLNVEIGTYTHIAASLHYYQRHSPLIKNIIDEKNYCDSRPMPNIPELNSLKKFLDAEIRIRTGNVKSDELSLFDEYWLSMLKVLVGKKNRMVS